MVETLTPFQLDRSKRLDWTTKHLNALKTMFDKAQKPSILVRYDPKDEDKKYEVTPRTLFAMWLIQRSLVSDLERSITLPEEIIMIDFLKAR